MSIEFVGINSYSLQAEVIDVTARILHRELWPTITRLARKSRRKYVAVAYLGKGACRLLPLSNGDSLVVDMSEGTIKGGQTNPWEVEKYYKRGVNVYTCANLHAKVYVFDNKLVVGSANVSQSSKYTLLEAGLLCQDRDAVTEARGWVKSLMLEPVTPGYLKLCKKWYRPPISRGRTGGPPPPPPPTPPSLWVISVSPTQFPEQEEHLLKDAERKASKKLKDPRKSEVESIRFIGKYNYNFTGNAKEGDKVIEIWNSGNKKFEVYPQARILRITRYKSFDSRKQPRTFVHIEMPKRPQTIPWRDFKKEVARAGIRRISPYCVRRIRNQEVRNHILGLWR